MFVKSHMVYKRWEKGFISLSHIVFENEKGAHVIKEGIWKL